MTVAQMVDAFLLRSDRMLSLSTPGYEDTEILEILNEAQNEILRELVRDKNYAALEDLQSSYVFNTLLAFTEYSNAHYVDMGDTLSNPFTNTGFRYYVSSSSSLTRSAVPVLSNTVVPNEVISRDQAGHFAYNWGFNAPIFRTPKVFFEGTHLIVMHDAYTDILALHLQYIKAPKLLNTATNNATLTTTSEIREDIHDDIVNRAVRLASIITQPEKATLDIQNSKLLKQDIGKI